MKLEKKLFKNWKSFQFSHTCAKPKKGGNTNLKSKAKPWKVPMSRITMHKTPQNIIFNLKKIEGKTLLETLPKFQPFFNTRPTSDMTLANTWNYIQLETLPDFQPWFITVQHWVWHLVIPRDIQLETLCNFQPCFLF